MRSVVLLLLGSMVAAACSGGSTVDDDRPSVTTSPVTTSPITTSPVTTSPVALSPEDVPRPLQDLELATVSVDGRDLLVAVADDDETRSRGLQHVEDLGPLDGMLFSYEADVQTTFWMKDTLIPLDIVFFDAAGSFVDGVTLQPCFAEPCSEHTPDAAFRYVLETPEGGLADTGPGSVLSRF